MRFETLVSTITTPYFFSYQLLGLFPHESTQALKMQLSRFVKRNALQRLKRGLYLFPDRKIDELVISSILYQPSYISLETALHLHGIIPDIPSTITNIASITPNLFVTPRGSYSYSKIDKRLFYGFTRIINHENNLSYNLAEPEKAILDWLYIRKISNLNSFRVNLKNIDKNKLSSYINTYPKWLAKNFNQ